MTEYTLSTETSALRDEFQTVPPPEPVHVWQPREMQDECFPAPGQHLVG